MVAMVISTRVLTFSHHDSLGVPGRKHARVTIETGLLNWNDNMVECFVPDPLDFKRFVVDYC